MGVLVVTSGGGGQSWLVRNGGAGIHTRGPQDALGASEAIRNLADDRDLWNRLSENAKEKARNMTSYKIIRDLDDAITEEMVKESGLTHVPHETISTLAEPERVLKTWSKGNWGIVATDRRLFVRHGRISRKITEIPYDSIAYIEHTRRYPWKILLAGFSPAFILLLEPMWRAILQPSFISTIQTAANSIITAIPQLVSIQTLALLTALIPCITGMATFALQARTGFNLYGSSIKLVYLPHGFREAITFIRNVQDKQNAPDTEKTETKMQ